MTDASYEVYDTHDKWIMTAPLSTIALVFNLHIDAVRRVRNNTNEPTTLHFNDRLKLGYAAIELRPNWELP